MTLSYPSIAMQLFALDRQIPVLATHAEKHRNYECPECKQPVRLRSGPHRQAHYFHIQRSSNCRQHQKSAEHIQAQLKLLTLLPEGECALERPFPAISRIADAAWETAQIVFEIQCSPISQQEVKERTADYKTMGMNVVWILHDKRFNQKNLSAAEDHLRNQPCYYTNITPSGTGVFYDQFEIIQEAIRKYKGPSLPISVHLPCPVNHRLACAPVQSIKQRSAQWNLSFEGDLLHRLGKANEKSWISLAAIERKFHTTTWANFKPVIALRRIYTLLLDGLIRFCSSR